MKKPQARKYFLTVTFSELFLKSRKIFWLIGKITFPTADIVLKSKLSSCHWIWKDNFQEKSSVRTPISVIFVQIYISLLKTIKTHKLFFIHAYNATLPFVLVSQTTISFVSNIFQVQNFWCKYILTYNGAETQPPKTSLGGKWAKNPKNILSHLTPEFNAWLSTIFRASSTKQQSSLFLRTVSSLSSPTIFVTPSFYFVSSLRCLNWTFGLIL